MYTHVRRYRTVFSCIHQIRIQLYPRKVVYFLYLIRILISNNTMRSKHVFVQKGYDKDTIQGYDTKYDTRILLTIGKIKSPKNQIKTYALDLMNMVMITHFCNWPTFWWSPAFFFVETLVFVTRNHWHSMQLIPLFGVRPSFLGYRKWVRDSG